MLHKGEYIKNKAEKNKQVLKQSSYPGEESFLAGVDPEARDGGGGEAGAVGGLLHATDLGHGPLLLVLLLGGGRHDVHVMLLLCQTETDTILTPQHCNFNKKFPLRSAGKLLQCLFVFFIFYVDYHLISTCISII